MLGLAHRPLSLPRHTYGKTISASSCCGSSGLLLDPTSLSLNSESGERQRGRKTPRRGQHHVHEHQKEKLNEHDVASEQETRYRRKDGSAATPWSKRAGVGEEGVSWFSCRRHRLFSKERGLPLCTALLSECLPFATEFLPTKNNLGELILDC